MIVHPDSNLSSKNKLLMVLTEQRFTMIDFSSCLTTPQPSESTTGVEPTQTTSTPTPPPPPTPVTTGGNILYLRV
jgi:hypothetical protein